MSLSALSAEAWANLRESNLTDETVELMRIRMATQTDYVRSTPCSVFPYLLPAPEVDNYVTLYAGDDPFYRVRVLRRNNSPLTAFEAGNGAPVFVPKDGTVDEGPKYLQPKGTGSH